MISDSGEVGLYWDLDGGYAEASFDRALELAFFSRDNDGIERFDDHLTLTNLDTAWFWRMIGPLDGPNVAVA